MHRDGLRAGAHFKRHTVVLQQQLELLKVVVSVQVGPGEGGFKPAGACYKAVAELCAVDGFLQFARHGFGMNAHEGITSPDVPWQGFSCYIALHGASQMSDLLAINLLYLSKCIGSVAVAGWGDEAG